MSKKSIYMTVTLVTLLLSVAACKSTTELGETQTMESPATDSASADVTPTPEPAFEDSTSQEVAQSDSTYIPPEPTAPAAPVESLGASSSGLGR